MIAIIFSGSFPNGSSYANRMLSLAKSLTCLDIKTKIFILYPGDNKDNILNTQLTGSADNIEYQYLINTSINPQSRIKKLFLMINGVYSFLRSISSENELNYIISGTSNLLQTLPVYIFTRIKKIKFVRELNEFPKEILVQSSLGLFKWKIYGRFRERIFDSLIVISTTLKIFYQEQGYKEKQILLLPINVDIERFNCSFNQRSFIITLCGNLYSEKDGVELLVKAFGKFVQKFHEYKLQLVGDIKNEEKIKKLLSLISELELDDKIIFTSYISRDKIPEYLCKSDILVLPRPDNTQAKAGFPTKLGEYLATGKPVVVTDTSDIGHYLKNGVSAYFIEAGSIESLEKKFEYVVNNYDKALEVGKNGRKVAENFFDYRVQTLVLKDFLGKN